VNHRKPTIIFSVDVEDWGQSVLDRRLPIGDHCADNVRRLIEMLAGIPNAQATFFVLGKFARKHPQVVRELVQEGHEVACHGFGHVEVHELGPRRLANDLRAAKDEISNAAGVLVTGYRAPVFSIGRHGFWALDVLADEGFLYDSSVFPFDGPRYGVAGWPDEARSVKLADGRSITEFPMTTTRVGGCKVPISGGGYARLIPRTLLVRFFRREAIRRKTWPVFYCHPYEIDPNEFRRKTPSPSWGTRRIKWSLKLNQSIGRRGFVSKLEALMNAFQIRSFRQAMDELETFQDLVLADVESCPERAARVLPRPGQGEAHGDERDSESVREELAEMR